MKWNIRRHPRDFPYTFARDLESADIGLNFRATIWYGWKILGDFDDQELIHLDASARTLLRGRVETEIKKYRISDRFAAEDHANYALRHPLKIDGRFSAIGRVRLKVPRYSKTALRRQTRLEKRMVSTEQVETMRLKMIHRRIVDPQAGLAWWLERYADLQFAASNPEDRLKVLIDAFRYLHEYANASDVESEKQNRVYLQRRLEQVIHSLDDPNSFALAMQVIERFLEASGVKTSAGDDVAEDRRSVDTRGSSDNGKARRH